MHAVPVVAELGHQGREDPGDPGRVHPRPGQGCGEPETRQRRDHQMEGVGGVAAVATGIGQGPDHVEEVDHRAGPAVQQDQRCGVWFGRAHVQVVQILPVDGDQVLRVLVENGLLSTPVVVGAPVVGHLPEISGGDSAAPADPGKLLRPPGGGQAGCQVVELRLRDVDPERAKVGPAGCHATHARTRCGQLLS